MCALATLRASASRPVIWGLGCIQSAHIASSAVCGHALLLGWPPHASLPSPCSFPLTHPGDPLWHVHPHRVVRGWCRHRTACRSLEPRRVCSIRGMSTAAWCAKERCQSVGLARERGAQSHSCIAAECTQRSHPILWHQPPSISPHNSMLTNESPSPLPIIGVHRATPQGIINRGLPCAREQLTCAQRARR